MSYYKDLIRNTTLLFANEAKTTVFYNYYKFYVAAENCDVEGNVKSVRWRCANCGKKTFTTDCQLVNII